MSNEPLYNVARQYVRIIESIEREHVRERLAELEEERAVWHNRLIEMLRVEGIPFKDREHVARIAYRIIERYET